MTTFSTSPERIALTHPAIEWPFNEPLIERWKAQALTNEFCRSGLITSGRWSRRSDEERFVVESLLGLSATTPLDIHVMSCLDRSIIVTPVAGQYEHPTGYHLALNGSPPRGRAFIAIEGGGRLEARYHPWFADGWKRMPQQMAGKMLSFARSVSLKTFPV